MHELNGLESATVSGGAMCWKLDLIDGGRGFARDSYRASYDADAGQSWSIYKAAESSGGSKNNMREVESSLQLAALALGVAAAATVAIPPVSASLGVSAAGFAGLSFVAGAYK